VSTPLVSVVVPLHDARATIAETLDSVRDQTVADWELIVVDDASTDGGLAWAEVSAGDLAQPVTLLRSAGDQPQGPSAARNRGLAEATGRYVAFLDADDRWAPTFLARRLDQLGGDDGPAMAWGPVRYWYSDDPGTDDFTQPTGLADRAEASPTGAPLAGWLADQRHTPCPSAVVLRREAVVAVGGFEEGLRRGEDIALWIELAADHPSAYDPEVLVDYRRHPGSATSRATLAGVAAADDLAFARWAVAFVAGRPDLSGLRPVAARMLHGIAHRSVQGLGPLTARRRITGIVLGPGGARSRWWAVGLDWVLPLRTARRVAGRLGGLAHR
jgi:glycosyltransferase involved in cell wall biosynthesis